MRPFAICFIGIAELFVNLPTWETVEGGRAPSVTALSNTDRIELLLDWWNASHDERFTQLALALARAPVNELNPWLDGREAIELPADSDEAGRVFRFESGHPFRFESGHHSDLKAAGVGHPAGRWL
jgi:hypothetical protein